MLVQRCQARGFLSGIDATDDWPVSHGMFVLREVFVRDHVVDTVIKQQYPCMTVNRARDGPVAQSDRHRVPIVGQSQVGASWLVEDNCQR